MAWRSALTRDALVALKGEDGIGNGTERDSGSWRAQEEERQAEDNDDEEAKSKQNTFRNLDKGFDMLRIGTSLGSMESSSVYNALHGRRATTSGTYSREMVTSGIDLSPSTALRPSDVETNMPSRLNTGIEKASRTGTMHGAASRPETKLGSSRHTKSSHGSTSHLHTAKEKKAWSMNGTGQDIVLFLKPSLPGVGHTEYSDWSSSEGHKPHLPRCTVRDYMSGPDNMPTHYVEVRQALAGSVAVPLASFLRRTLARPFLFDTQATSLVYAVESSMRMQTKRRGALVVFPGVFILVPMCMMVVRSHMHVDLPFYHLWC